MDIQRNRKAHAIIAIQDNSAKSSFLICKANDFFSPGASDICRAPAEKNHFALQMRKLDFAELSWIANDSVSLSISLYNPKNEDFYNQIAFEDDSVSFIAPETGEYTIDFEIRNSSEIKEPQNITLEYKNVFKQPPGSVVKATRQVNGYIVKILLSPQTKSQYGKSIVLFEKVGNFKIY